MTTLLPPNATSQERAIETATARMADIPTPQRDLWDADRCPAELLPWLAWALSVDTWKPYWPEHIKRARVRVALEVARKKGTAKSVRDIVASFGGAVALREWWENDPPSIPHTFSLTLTLSGAGGETASAQFVNDVIEEVRRTKPLRSQFEFTQGVSLLGAIGIVAAARPTVYRRVQFDAA